MRMTTNMAVLCLLYAAAVAAAAGPELVNARRVFPEGEPTWKTPRRYHLWAMRLSPDGKTALYPRAKGQPLLTPEGAPDWHKVKYEIVLRDLETKTDTVLPIHPLDSGWETVFTRFNMFDPTDTKLVLANIELMRQEAGKHTTFVRSAMKIVLYDIPTGKLTPTNIEGPIAITKFGRGGNVLLVMKRSRKGMELSTAALPELELQPLKARGMLHSVCPTADVACLWSPPKRMPPTVPGQRPQRGPQRLFLYDIEADKKIVELPVHPRNRSLDDLETQWTMDGGYLYYYDVREVTAEAPSGSRKPTRPVARIWDRVRNKAAGRVFDAIPVGAGPTPTTMVLAKAARGGSGGVLLHDAKSGREYPLGDSSMKLVHACGTAVLYAKPTAGGASVAYIADIRMPKPDKAPPQ